MSLVCNSTVQASIYQAETLTIGLTTDNVSETLGVSLSFTNGTGAGKVNERWTKGATATAAAVTYTLSSLTDALGRTIAFTKVRALLIVNKGTNALTVGDAGTNPWVAPFGGATQTVTVPAGGALLLLAPDASGLAVTASSSDQLKIDPGANTVEFEISIVGE